VRRIHRQATTRVSEIARGPAEVSGRLSAAGEPLTSLSGARVLAIKWSHYHTYRAPKDDEGYRTLQTTTTRATEIELTDDTGSALLELDRMILIGPTRRYVLRADGVKRDHAALWEEIASQHAPETKIEEVYVDETVLPEGVNGFVSGEASESDRADTSGYRRGKRLWKLTGRSERPLVVAAYDEATVVARLHAPLRRLLVFAGVAFFVGCAAICLPLWIGG
jgi:hypothetical protein